MDYLVTVGISDLISKAILITIGITDLDILVAIPVAVMAALPIVSVANLCVLAVAAVARLDAAEADVTRLAGAAVTTC